MDLGGERRTGHFTGYSVTLDTAPSLLDQSLLLDWVPGAGFALILLFLLRRIRHFLALPLALVLGTACCYAALWAFKVPLSIEAGQVLIRQREPSSELCFLESGRVSIYLEPEHLRNHRLRLRSIGAGSPVGELSFYLNQPRSASVIADSPCRVFRLTKDSLQRMSLEKPALFTAFHEYMAILLADRLFGTTATLRAIAD